ncbi:flavin reductase like protein [Nitzschia inconspicua]|uniref:Flavin reductase like protein n=1 Tax=Nitzschia inconspicua TaxID=303405 RepID=A0A9K3L151_9STRA|nr:flavin reductase like protein [Nitzschia inconspicua]
MMCRYCSMTVHFLVRFSLVLWAMACTVESLSSSRIEPTSTPPLLDVPVYSLATLNADGSTNMNILTYATPVSIIPTRVWSLGLFKETLSGDNLRRSGVCVLQLLNERHVDLIPLLGGTSGRNVDKLARCADLGSPWTDLNDDDGFQVLPGCTSYLKMTIKGGVVDAGSHFIVPFCEVTDMYSTVSNGNSLPTNGDSQHLCTGELRDLGIITDKGRVSESKQYSL